MTKHALLINRRKASIQAALWLEKLIETEEETKALKQLGLLLCNCIRNSLNGLQANNSEALRLPRIERFVCMSRSDILEITNRACLVSPEAWNIKSAERLVWAKVFGEIALSYARTGDLQVVAALVRGAAHLNLNNVWLDELEMYLLDQQQTNGSFGLLSSELSLLKDKLAIQHCQLRLTVEVLWTLAERVPVYT